MRLSFRLNGEPVEVDVRADETLLTVLRTRLGVLSARDTCGIGVCGACTALIDGELASTCLLLAPLVEGAEVTTAESLPADDPVVAAFAEERAFQCGYCTPGMVLAARALLAESPAPADPEIRAALAGNLCRCGSYVRIAAAVRRASV